MLIIPAIDLKDQKVVRYTKGKLNKKVYSDDPVSTALEWQRQGARLLHLVDLDGAMTGRQKNIRVIGDIIKAIRIPAEVGGGIRSLEAARKTLDLGAKRVILGTKAIEDPDFLKKAITNFGRDKIILGLDASGEKIGLQGWKKSFRIGFSAFLGNLEQSRLKTIIYTDISRDGTLGGIDFKNVKRVLKASPFKVIVSGGISSLADIRKLRRLKSPNLEGVIIGKALYENRFTLKEAIEESKKVKGKR